VSAGAEAVIAKLPAVDVLVNNVGIFEPKPFAEIPDADWYRLFEINVMSGVRLSRHCLAGTPRASVSGIAGTADGTTSEHICGMIIRPEYLPNHAAVTPATPAYVNRVFRLPPQ
jgi:NAD(P)-dependent dehydrogenase (short-subunit alcohol dehydrogenase family)